VGYAETNPLVYGSEGSIGVCCGKIVIQRPGKEEEALTPPPTEYPKRTAPEYLLYCIENKVPVEGFCSPKVSRDAQEILEAGLRSANTGQTLTLPIPA
jgi:hypothetical protein